MKLFFWSSPNHLQVYKTFLALGDRKLASSLMWPTGHNLPTPELKCGSQLASGCFLHCFLPQKMGQQYLSLGVLLRKHGLAPRAETALWGVSIWVPRVARNRRACFPGFRAVRPAPGPTLFSWRQGQSHFVLPFLRRVVNDCLTSHHLAAYLLHYCVKGL